MENDSGDASLYDVVVIGAGINGAGIARDAAGQKLKVLLVEQGDIAGATSSASSKLIHGGLRYLEHFEFRLVRESLAERESLLKIAPHIVRPMRFILPHLPSMRPRWMVRFGLKLYDFLGANRTLPSSASVRFKTAPELRGPLSPKLKHGFSYADCWTEDARLVLLNVQDAVARGADIALHTRFESAHVKHGKWQVTLQPESGKPAYSVQARSLVNAAGPWVSRVLGQAGSASASKARWVKGSHIIVPRLPDAHDAYLLQMRDGRVVFVLPFEQEFTLIGTTDIEYQGDLRHVEISPEEIAYLCEGVSNYLAQPVSPEHVVWSYAGVRSLYDDGSKNPSKLTRDYVLELDTAHHAPLLSVFGGKLTTYRRLAEHALAKLLPELGREPRSWTAEEILPGGDLPKGGTSALAMELHKARPWLDEKAAQYFARIYGSASWDFLPADRAAAGEEIAPGIYECELRYSRDHEWALHGEDFLWRRTKWGIHLTPAQRHDVMRWFETPKKKA